MREIRCPIAEFKVAKQVEEKDEAGAVTKKTELEDVAVGKVVGVLVLDQVAFVDVVGVSKGCGFQGVMKRHHFSGQRASHGVKKVHRHPGGTGGLAAWRGGGRPKKGKKMAGHMGHDRVTARNLKVVRIDPDNNLLLVHGAVPGPAGGMLIIRETNKLG